MKDGVSQIRFLQRWIRSNLNSEHGTINAPVGMPMSEIVKSTITKQTEKS